MTNAENISMNDMTRKEAIELLDNLLGVIEDNHGSDYDRALHMAINSLKTDEAYQLEYEHIPTITITVEEYMHLRECEAKCKTDYRNCGTCIHSKDGYCAGTETCHECMWDNKYERKKDITSYIDNVEPKRYKWWNKEQTDGRNN